MTQATKVRFAEGRKRHVLTLAHNVPSLENIAHACELQATVRVWSQFHGASKAHLPTPKAVPPNAPAIADELKEVRGRLALLEGKLVELSAIVGSASTARVAEVAVLFAKLREEWRMGTRTEASLATILMHRAYQRIIGMGSVVIPMIMDELRREPDHWHWALESITGVDPVPDEAAGDLDAIADAWLAWWKAKAPGS